MDCGPRRRFNLRIFGGSSHPELTKLVAKKVGVRVGQNKLKKFANKVRIFFSYILIIVLNHICLIGNER